MSGFPNQFPSRATPESIISLPNYTITNPETTCPVCMDPFIVNTQAKILPCKHVYHRHCIIPWLERKNSCPMCRYELPAIQEHDEPYRMDMNGFYSNSLTGDYIRAALEAREERYRRLMIGFYWNSLNADRNRTSITDLRVPPMEFIDEVMVLQGAN